MASRRYRRMSVATWSLRLRPVCRLLAGVADFVGQTFSTFMCTSSRSTPIQSGLPGCLAESRPCRHFDGAQIGFGQHAGAGEHGGVGQRALDVERGHAFIEINRGGVFLTSSEPARKSGRTRRARLAWRSVLKDGRRRPAAGDEIGVKTRLYQPRGSGLALRCCLTPQVASSRWRARPRSVTASRSAASARACSACAASSTRWAVTSWPFGVLAVLRARSASLPGFFRQAGGALVIHLRGQQIIVNGLGAAATAASSAPASARERVSSNMANLGV